MGSGRDMVIEENPDHRRHLALGHQRRGAGGAHPRAVERAAEAAIGVGGGIGLRTVRIAGRQRDPPLDRGGAAGESGHQLRRDVDGFDILEPGFDLGAARCGHRGEPCREIARGNFVVEGQRRDRPRQGRLDHGGDEIAGAAPAIIIIVVAIEHRLQAIGAGRKVRPRGRKGIGVGADERGRARRKMRDLARRDRGPRGIEGRGVDLFLGLGARFDPLRENEQPPARVVAEVPRGRDRRRH